LYIIPPNPKGKVNYLLIFIEGFSAVTAFPLKPPQKAAWDQKIPGGLGRCLLRSRRLSSLSRPAVRRIKLLRRP